MRLRQSRHSGSRLAQGVQGVVSGRDDTDQAFISQLGWPLLPALQSLAPQLSPRQTGFRGFLGKAGDLRPGGQSEGLLGLFPSAKGLSLGWWVRFLFLPAPGSLSFTLIH